MLEIRAELSLPDRDLDDLFIWIGEVMQGRTYVVTAPRVTPHDLKCPLIFKELSTINEPDDDPSRSQYR